MAYDSVTYTAYKKFPTLPEGSVSAIVGTRERGHRNPLRVSSAAEYTPTEM